MLLHIRLCVSMLLRDLFRTCLLLFLHLVFGGVDMTVSSVLGSCT